MFHVPRIHGDDRILEKMNRKYPVREVARLIESIYTGIPLAAIGIDIISGFPGEDTVAHKNTCSLIKDLPVSYLHVFPFSPRPGTAASAFRSHVDPKVIKKKAAELRDLGQAKRALFYDACLKKEFLVLSEEWYLEEKKIMKGISDNYLPVFSPRLRIQKTSLFLYAWKGWKRTW